MGSTGCFQSPPSSENNSLLSWIPVFLIRVPSSQAAHLRPHTYPSAFPILFLPSLYSLKAPLTSKTRNGSAHRHGLSCLQGQLFVSRRPPTSVRNDEPLRSYNGHPPRSFLRSHRAVLPVHTCLHCFQLAARWRLFYLNVNK